MCNTMLSQAAKQLQGPLFCSCGFVHVVLHFVNRFRVAVHSYTQSSYAKQLCIQVQEQQHRVLRLILLLPVCCFGAHVTQIRNI